MDITICLAVIAMFAGLFSVVVAKYPAIINNVTMRLWIRERLDPGTVLMTTAVSFCVAIFLGHWTGMVPVIFGYGLTMTFVIVLAVYARSARFGSYMHGNTDLRIISQNGVIKVQYRRVETTTWYTIKKVDDKDDGVKLISSICRSIENHRRFRDLEVLRTARA